MSQSTSLFSYPVGTLLFAVSDHHTIVPIKVADVQCIDEQSEGPLYRLKLTLETPEKGKHPISVGSAFEAYFNTFYVLQDALPGMVFLTLDEACLRALENCAEEIGYQERIVSTLKSKQVSLIAKRGHESGSVV
jgi:hypothetical protein